MPRTVTWRAEHLVPLARVALLVAVGDYVTKAAAASFLADAPTTLASWLRLAVVHNDQAAFGVSLGAYTWQLNLALTLSAVAFMVPVSRDLSRIDRLAPIALGMIVGGAIGNLTSLVLSARGVVDFIAVRWGASGAIVLNVADVAAYVGLAMICRTGFLIVDRLRDEVRTPSARPQTARELGIISIADREVGRVIHREPSPMRAERVREMPRPMSHEAEARSTAAGTRRRIVGLRALRPNATGDTHIPPADAL
jgi:lipoprotein signal peptidase